MNAQNDYTFYIDELNDLDKKIVKTDIKAALEVNGITREHIKENTPSLTISKKTNTSGTGFALAANGLIVTNYHVVVGGTSITVKGINGDFSKSYTAKVVISDIENDLTIIKIEDVSFHSITAIPYNIKSLNSEVGEDIFVLGFPLRATMGEEIKLTNGIISSGTGFQGDIRSYQVSASIQPGNSGGPLFNKDGRLIGIVKSKHTGAENVAYAIKADYLKRLITLLPELPILNDKNKMSHLSLSRQVKILSDYVYIIEIR